MNLPEGDVTLLFTDIEGSTKLWEVHPEAMQEMLALHDQTMRMAIQRHGGHVFKTLGDAFYAVFPNPRQGLAGALDAQKEIAAVTVANQKLRVRMALHTGEAERRDNDFFGPTLNRVARLLAVGHGGQVLLSQASRDQLVEGVFLDLGMHRLKDLQQPEHVWQVGASTFPPLRSLSLYDNNLPQQLTSFVGRTRELAEIKSQLERSRLLTLTGSGGTGKTRLSLQVVAEVLEQFPGGVWLVELAPLTDPNLVPQLVAHVLNVNEVPGEPLTKTLVAALKERQLLLVLDNGEHVLDACAKLVDSLMRDCPKVRILLSSREPLGIAGESTYRVPSLSLPSRKAEYTPETLIQFEAVNLFVERAILIKPDFTITKNNVTTLVQVCHQLDGIPLAIELAAARIRSMPIEQLATRLEDRFRILTGGSRTALPRQQTLRALIDWSYDLLEENQKALLCRLSVFVGGCTLESVEAVCCGEGIDSWEVLELLTALCDKSLVVYEEVEGEARYRLLETIRQYARDRLLERGASEGFRDQHLAYYLALVEEAELHLRGAKQKVWLDRLDRERDNLRAALEWSITSSRGIESALRFSSAVWLFWLTRGYLTEGWELLARVRALRTLTAGDAALRARVLGGAGSLAYALCDYVSAKALYEESLAIRREVNDRVGIANALGNLAMVLLRFSDTIPAAKALYEESIAIRRELGDRAGIASSLEGLANLAAWQGDFTEARVMLEEVLPFLREIGHLGGIASSLNNLGMIAYAQYDFSSSRALHEESLALRRELGDRGGLSLSLGNLGDVAVAEGNYTSARALFDESLAIRCDLGDRRGIFMLLYGYAALATALEAPLTAARLWGAAQELFEEFGASLPTYKRERYLQPVALVRTTLGDATFDAAWTEGRALTMEQAIELALEKPKVGE